MPDHSHNRARFGMRLIVSVALLFALSACVSTPSVETDRAALAEANLKYDAALIAADAAALRELYADEFRYFGPNHVVRDKAQQIEALTSGAVDLIFGKSSDVEIRIYGSTAVLTGRFNGRVSVSGREFAFSERYSTVWVRQQKRWRMVLEHGSVIEEGK